MDKIYPPCTVQRRHKLNNIQAFNQINGSDATQTINNGPEMVVNKIVSEWAGDGWLKT